MKRYLRIEVMLFSLLIWIVATASAQQVSQVYSPSIHTIQLFPYGNQQGLPLIKMGSGDKLELEFDDLDGNYKNYYYTFVLCDYNWKPSNLSAFDYIKGFTQNRIATYRYSNIAFENYTHYQAFFPDANSTFTRSGNYLLKVYLDGDTSKTVFTRQFMVLDQKAVVTAEVVQPFTPQLFNTHQRVRFHVNVKDINSFSAAQQVKAVVLQNNRWDMSMRDIAPTFVRGSMMEYNSEAVGVFPGMREWRWLDLRSFRLLSDRVDSGKYDRFQAEFYLKPDKDRTADRYAYFADLDGMYQITTYESINPFWQGDYANVHFRYFNTDGKSFSDKDLYLTGALTGYQYNNQSRLTYNPATGFYEQTLRLKQGYYNYAYVTKNKVGEIASLEGNYWETENSYSVLIYYKAFNDRVDQLIGVTVVNSRSDRPGFSF
jgi:hypothetical protein